MAFECEPAAHYRGASACPDRSVLCQGRRAQERREREPNSVYSARRAKLAAQVDGPIVLWGFTGHEEFAQTYIFEQEQNFYYLTGHNEEGAAMLILPSSGSGFQLPTRRAKFFFCPPRIPPRKSGTACACHRPIRASLRAPASPRCEPFADMKATVEKLAKSFSADLHHPSLRKGKRRLPARKGSSRLARASLRRNAKLKDIRAQISAHAPDQIARRDRVSARKPSIFRSTAISRRTR